MKKIFFIVIYCFFYANLLFGQIAKKDSLIELLKTQLTDTHKVNIHNELAYQLRNSDIKTAKENASQALKLAEKINYKKGIAEAYGYLGLLYLRLGIFDKSAENHFKSLKIAQEINYDKLVGYRYNDIANVYLEQGFHEQALSFFTKSLAIKQKIKDIEGITTTNGNIGKAYLLMGNYKNAEPYTQQAIIIAEKYNFKRILAINYGNLGKILLSQQKFKEALFYQEKALAIEQTIQNKAGYTETLYDIALIYHHKKEFQEALKIFKKTLDSAQFYGIKVLEHQIYASAANTLRQLNQSDTAFQLLQKSNALRDSIFNQKSTERLVNIYAELDSEQKQLKIQLLHEQSNLQMYFLFGSFIILFLLAVLTLILIVNNKKSKKINQQLTLQRNELSEKNEEINQQKEEMQVQAEGLTQLNYQLTSLDKYKEGLIGMIVHDLKNPLNTILGLADKPELKLAGRQMMNMVQNILDVQKFEDTTPKLYLVSADILSVSVHALYEVSLLIERKNIKVINKISPIYICKVDIDLISRVFVNLFTNAIKYTPNNGSIILDAVPQGNQLSISVSDTGQGIPVDKLEMVFDKFMQIEPRQIGAVRSSGLGLAFCKMAIEAHKGKIWATSEIGKGANFHFTLELVNAQWTLTDDKDFDFHPAQSILKENQTPLHLQTVFSDYRDWSVANLSDEEKAILQPFVLILQKYSVYEYSDIYQVLQQFDVNDNKNLSIWKQQIENAFRACNELKYEQLIYLN